MADKPPEKKPVQEMTELEKYHAGEPTDSAKLWAAMDDDMMDKLTEGISERKDGAPEEKPAEKPAE